MKQEKLTLTPGEIDISDIARTVLLGHGVRGAKLSVEHHPSGSHCTVNEHGTVHIVIDPEQLKNSYGEVVSDHAQAVAAHEVGHALFELSIPGRPFAPESRKDGFFQCLIQDTVIDAGQTRMPAFANAIRSLYREVIMAGDLTQQPLCSQLMYALRIEQVMGVQPDVSDEVRDAIATLREHQAANGTVFNILDVLTDSRTTPAAALRIADQYIKPIYDTLAEEDEQNSEQNLDGQLGNSSGQCGHTEQTGEQANSNQRSPGDASSDRLPDIKQQIEQAAAEAREQSEQQRGKTAQELADEAEKRAEQQQRNARAGSIKSEMQLSDADAEAYLNALERHPEMIRGVAEVFLQLARPSMDRQRLAYTRQRVGSGALLHHDLTNLVLSNITNQPHPFWRNIKREARRREISFNGLDVHLLCDVSESMKTSGAAKFAAVSGMGIAEGLDLARQQAAKTSGSLPDVRQHIVAFGSGTKELSPLSHTVSPTAKGRMFTSLRNAKSSSTNIADALESCLGTPPERDSIIIAISDGEFHDHKEAQELVSALPANAYFAQLIIGSKSTIKPLAENYQTLDNPALLPHYLLLLLQQFTERYQ